ncbi:MAG: 4Fe-4S binding protein [Actinobacteria bacterium]|nr:4Fe-4S binding protein [Actinomycetota bacterium]
MILTNPHSCPQNHACPAVRACPAGAVVQDDIFSAPHIDYDLCMDCGVCTRVCRVFTQVMEEVGVH